MAPLPAEFDRLAAQASTKLVVTHGEPHPGNLIRTPQGLKLGGTPSPWPHRNAT